MIFEENKYLINKINTLFFPGKSLTELEKILESIKNNRA